MQRDHLFIAEPEDRLTLMGEDWKLFDFVDDHLIDHGIEHDYFTEERVGSVIWHVLHFHSNFGAARLKDALELIEPEEIERVRRVNN